MEEREILQKIYDNLDDGDGILDFYFDNYKLIIKTEFGEKFLISVQKI